MQRSRRRPFPSPAALGALAAVATLPLLLTGCAPEPAPPSSPSAPTTIPAPSQSAVPTPAPSTASPGPSASTPPPSSAAPLGLDCAQLVPAAAIYEFGPSFGLLNGWSPPSGSSGARALAADGVACRWVAESGGAVLDVSAATPGEAALGALRRAVQSGQAASFGDTAYFTADAEGRGVLTVFAGDAWVAFASDYLGSAEDAAPLAEAAVASLDRS